MGTDDFRIAFLLNGPDEHGLVRASRILAGGLANLGGCAVTLVRTSDATPPLKDADGFYERFQEADVVVVHGSTRTSELWGPPPERGDTIAAFCAAVRPPVVMYLHDVYGDTRLRFLVASLARSIQSVREFGGLRGQGTALMRQVVGRAHPLEAVFIRRVAPSLAGFLVSNELERKRLRRHGRRTPVDVVPHFIEKRASLMGNADAKARIGLSHRLVITLLGYIHARKGHDLALSILEQLPPHTVLVFAGTTVDRDSAFFQELLIRIGEMGGVDRVRITGYLSDDALDVYLSATDVALCPFREVSASGSVATWFAAGKPVVATDLPLFRLYREEFGDGVLLAPRGDAAAFARLVTKASAPSAVLEARIRSAAQRYSVENTAKLMLSSLKRMVKRDSSA